MPFLIERIAGQQPVLERVDGEVLLIGRGTNCELRLDDGAVALEHAVIERGPTGYRLVDRGSVTGTYVNGKAVASVYLADGDAIGIGGFRLRVRWKGPAEPLFLSVGTIAAQEEAGPAPLAVREVDYRAAYRLRRPFLTKGTISLLLLLAAAAAMAMLPIRGLHRAFQPGGLIDPHAKEMQGKPRAGCLDCHAPWKGPAKALCSECHSRSEHQARQAFDPSCSDCHFEHRGMKSMLLVSDASCISCHGDLKVKGGGEPAVDRRVESFPEGHPDFFVTLAAGPRPRPRIPLAEAVQQKADPGRLRFGHRRHLEEPLLTTEGERVQLTCEGCHRVSERVEAAAGPTAMRPVEYETACARCHALTFDPRIPDQVAPHGDPVRVQEFLARVYSRRQGLSVTEIRRRIIRNPGALPPLDLGARAAREAIEAERYLYGTACRECHEVNLEARPVSTVVPAGLPRQWLSRSLFSHADHAGRAACIDCHGNAAASSATEDVLIPGIASCGGCHGGSGSPPGNAKRVAGPSGCRDCHFYHPQEMGR